MLLWFVLLLGEEIMHRCKNVIALHKPGRKWILQSCTSVLGHSERAGKSMFLYIYQKGIIYLTVMAYAKYGLNVLWNSVEKVGKCIWFSPQQMPK